MHCRMRNRLQRSKMKTGDELEGCCRSPSKRNMLARFGVIAQERLGKKIDNGFPRYLDTKVNRTWPLCGGRKTDQE